MFEGRESSVEVHFANRGDGRWKGMGRSVRVVKMRQGDECFFLLVSWLGLVDSMWIWFFFPLPRTGLVFAGSRSGRIGSVGATEMGCAGIGWVIELGYISRDTTVVYLESWLWLLILGFDIPHLT